MKYLKEIREQLPVNCMFNKVRVGCGGTTLALESADNYVIAVPYVSLIDNKISQNPSKSWFAVKSGVTTEDIENYVQMCPKKGITPKILTTYDGLPKVTETINPKDYRLLVDEYHILFQHYSFRYQAVRGVLDCYEKYKSFTFMSATPVTPSLDRMYMLKELKHIPYVEQDWSGDNNVIDVKVEAIKCKHVTAKVIDIIERHLSGEIEGNAYFFVNSVSFVEDVREKIALGSKVCRVIYSKNNKMHYPFERGETTDAPKKINFLTSTTFEGCDIFDENGVTYIVSDKYRKHTLLDISTSVQQIIGRIRDSKYKGRVVHICNTDNRLMLDPFEFEQKLQEAKAECLQHLPFLQNLPEETTDMITIDSVQCPFLIAQDHKFVYDDNLEQLMIYEYEVRDQYLCKASIEASYTNIDADIHVVNWMKSLKDLGITTQKQKSFKEAVKECREASERSNQEEDDMIARWQVKYPIIKDAIEKLGYEKIATCQYSQKAIKDKLLVENKRGDIAMKLITNMKLESGVWYSSADLKKKLQKCYDVLGIHTKAKGTDIEKYYMTKQLSKRVKTDGYVIYDTLQESDGVVAKMKLKKGEWYSSDELKQKLQECYDVLGIHKKAKGTDIEKYYTASREQRNVSTKGYVIYTPLYKKVQ